MFTTLYFVFVDFGPFAPVVAIVNGEVWTADARGLVFTADARPLLWSASNVPTTLTKRTGETRQYTMDFSAQPELAGTNAIGSVVSVVAVPLSLGAANVTITNIAVGSNTKQAVCWIAGGTDDTYYRVTFTVTVNGNNTVLEDCGYLLVQDE